MKKVISKPALLLSFFVAAQVVFGADVSSSPKPEKRLLRAEDFSALRDIDEPNIAPDGRSVAYIVTTANIEKDKLVGNLWLAKWDGSENRALTFGEKGASHPRWSPDGKWIAFLSGREDENEVDQLWLLPSDGGEAEKLTDVKGGVEDFAWAPDAKRIALVVKDPDPREPEKKEKEKKTVAPLVINRFQFKQDKEGYLTDRYSHIQLLDLTTRKLQPLTSGRHDDLLPSWSPTTNHIAFVSKRGDDPDRSQNWDIYVIGGEPGGKERQLTSSPEDDADPDWNSAPAWSADGKWIAFIRRGDPQKIEYGVHSSRSLRPATGKRRS